MKNWRKLKRRYWWLDRAARRSDERTVVTLIRRYPALRTYAGRRGTVLDILRCSAEHLLKPALQAGVHPDAGEPGGSTLLQSAVSEGELELVCLLLRYGADPNRRNDVNEVALGYACSWEQPEAAKLLVEAGADVNAVEEDPETGRRNTPLDCVRESCPELKEYLRARGAKHLWELEGESSGESQG